MLLLFSFTSLFLVQTGLIVVLLFNLHFGITVNGLLLCTRKLIEQLFNNTVEWSKSYLINCTRCIDRYAKYMESVRTPIILICTGCMLRYIVCIMVSSAGLFLLVFINSLSAGCPSAQIKVSFIKIDRCLRSVSVLPLFIY